MAPAEQVVLTIALIIEFVVGFTLNVCILLVYIGNLKNGLWLGPSDKVHLTKALVNLSTNLTMATQILIFHNVFWSLVVFTKEAFLWIVIVITSLTFYSYWLTALLCVYYCTHITNCAHQIFVWLKRNFSSHLLRGLLVSGLGSFAISFPLLWFCSIDAAENSTSESSGLRVTILNETYRAAFAILGFSLPFAIALVSTIVTAWFLINHMWRMKQNNWGLPGSKSQTQINAARTMVLFLLISVIYNVTLLLVFFIPPSSSNAIVIWCVIISYPTAEAIVIIQSSFKLRETLCGKFIYRKRRNSGEID